MIFLSSDAESRSSSGMESCRIENCHKTKHVDIHQPNRDCHVLLVFQKKSCLTKCDAKNPADLPTYLQYYLHFTYLVILASREGEKFGIFGRGTHSNFRDESFKQKHKLKKERDKEANIN